MHGNSYNTDAYTYSGPLGINPVVNSRSMNVFGGLVATLTFDSKDRIMINEDEIRYMDKPKQDEIYRLQ